MKLTDEELKWGRELLSGIDFLESLPKDEIDALAKSMGKSEYNPGQTIIFQGEFTNSLYLVHHGRVSVWVKAKEGGRKKVAEIGPRNYFGEMSLIGSTSARATLKAEESTVVYSIAGDDFYKIIQEDLNALQKVKDKIVERKKTLDEVSASGSK
ncbi:MAG: cyclic nucleotide-binding domain-containing protein [Elusimicrobia bacterium]|nr:cyclic nucleotide-binding domain-containing protein [Elusimicrobiota bacterium]